MQGDTRFLFISVYCMLCSKSGEEYILSLHPISTKFMGNNRTRLFDHIIRGTN
jgi:hypothetical protein